MSSPTPQPASPPRALRWAVAGSVVVMIAAGGLFYYASQMAAAKRQANGNEIAVTIHGHACEPNALDRSGRARELPYHQPLRPCRGMGNPRRRAGG